LPQIFAWIDASHQTKPVADNTPGQLLQCNPLIHVNDLNGLFTSDELTRVHDGGD
jgi:hypothetical protein